MTRHLSPPRLTNPSSQNLRPLALAWLVLITVALVPHPASAQLEEVVVTAQKREQSLQDVGVSVSAFTQQQLENLGIKNTTEITQQVPGLQLFTFSPAFTVFSLRGVSQNNFQDNLEAPVAVYIDGAYVASMNAINTQLFDMDRIEVLRGPQGTLFGRNATGGLIQYITHKASDKTLNGYVEVGGAQFNTQSVEAAVGGPFSDRVRGRFAGRWEKSDGYVEPGTALGRTATGRTSDGANGFSLRGTVQADVTDTVLLDLIAAYSRDHDVPTGEYVVSLAGYNPITGLGAFHNAVDPANPAAGPVNTFDRTPITGSGWRHWSDENPYMDRDMKSATAQVTAKVWEGMELVSISNWLKMHKFYIEDSAGGFGFFPYNTITDYDQWSEELRLSGQREKWRWQLGAYYLDMKWNTFQSVQGPLILGFINPTSNTQKMSTVGDIKSTNWSGFGQVEYDFAPQWTAIAGFRWSQDHKNLIMNRVYEDVPNGIAPTEVFNIATVPIPGINLINYGDWAARAQVNWKVQPKILLYASYNRGIKGGNWSLDPLGGVANENLKHGPEKLNSYEIGEKADLFGGIARLNSAAFYYDYKGYQAFSLTGLTPQVSNSNAHSYGGEIELTVSPTKGLDLMLGAALLHSVVNAVPDVFGGTVRAKFPNAPSASLNFLGRYEWPIPMLGGLVGVQIDGRWNDDQYLEGTNSEVSFEPAYSVWNASLSYRTNDDHVRINAFVKNFTDEQYRLYDLDLGQLGFIEQVFAPPRQFGVFASYHF